MKPKIISTETPTPPVWVGEDSTLTALWESSLTWRLEMISAQDDLDNQDRIRRLAHEHDIAKNTITLAEAERRWGKQNLRGNAKGRLEMWQDEPGSPWLTTTYAMRFTFGPEPDNDQ
jgi:hypothetical protein